MEYSIATKNKGNKKSEIIRYIFEHKNASKTELAKELGLSMPTVLQNTKELLEKELLVEAGEYESTGGRRAKTLAINGKAAYSVGVDITSDYMSFVLLNFAGSHLHHVRINKEFCNSLDYYRELGDELEYFIHEMNANREQILGVGISISGIINNEEKIVIKSHELNLEGTSLKIMERFIPYPLHFENDANAAMIAEQTQTEDDAIYLFISDTVGGAIKNNGTLVHGKNRKAGEFGHVVIVPNGRSCYCGKKGCVNSYCSVKALKDASGLQLEDFMEQVSQKNPDALKIWDEYLEYLAITVTNIRMMYDLDIVLGGDVGEYLEPYMIELGEKVRKYNVLDKDTGYLKTSAYKKGSKAAGAALYFIYQCIDDIY